MTFFSLCVSFSLSVHSLILSLSLALYCCHTICFGQFIKAGMFVGNAKDTRRFSTMPTDILSHSLDVFHSNFLVACNNYTIFNSAYGTSTFKPFASANNMQNKNNLIKSHGKFHRKNYFAWVLWLPQIIPIISRFFSLFYWINIDLFMVCSKIAIETIYFKTLNLLEVLYLSENWSFSIRNGVCFFPWNGFIWYKRVFHPMNTFRAQISLWKILLGKNCREKF